MGGDGIFLFFRSSRPSALAMSLALLYLYSSLLLLCLYSSSFLLLFLYSSSLILLCLYSSSLLVMYLESSSVLLFLCLDSWFTVTPCSVGRGTGGGGGRGGRLNRFLLSDFVFSNFLGFSDFSCPDASLVFSLGNASNAGGGRGGGGGGGGRGGGGGGGGVDIIFLFRFREV